jgi:acyl-coenzyme A synthetase/AMP-(fatty) acid ligase
MLTLDGQTTTGADVFGADPRNHLLWPTLVDHLSRAGADETALAAGDRTISYGALAAAAASGAEEIDGRFPPDSRILVASRNQLHVAVALCATLQSQSQPLLADPTSAERLRRLGREWRVAGAVGDADVLDESGFATLSSEQIERWLAPAATARLDFVPRAVAASEPAFWTFTSGTTGEPRAVVHAHGGPLAAYRAFAQGVLQLGPEDVTIATAGLPFVYALGNNFFFPLMAGGTAIVPSDLLLPTVLGELARHGATVLVAGPWSLAGMARLTRKPRWIDAFRRLRLVLSAGEPLPPRVFRDWSDRFGKEVLDNLGCTEMFNSFVSNRPGRAGAGSLGSPVSGFELEVGGSPPRPGLRGELRVRGGSRAIAIGSGGELAPPAGEWCEPGDEVEVDSSGEIVFLGRIDDRFKVKGQFVHPLEIERILAQVSGVAECLVAPEQDASGLAIVVAKVVAASRRSSEDLSRRVLRHARAHLAPFAVPERVDLVGALPRSARGKLQRRASPP